MSNYLRYEYIGQLQERAQNALSDLDRVASLIKARQEGFSPWYCQHSLYDTLQYSIEHLHGDLSIALLHFLNQYISRDAHDPRDSPPGPDMTVAAGLPMLTARVTCPPEPSPRAMR